MTLLELSIEYRENAGVLKMRIVQLQIIRGRTQDRDAREMLDERIRILRVMWRESRELAMLTEHYYDRGYRRNVKYTL